ADEADAQPEERDGERAPLAPRRVDAEARQSDAGRAGKEPPLRIALRIEDAAIKAIGRARIEPVPRRGRPRLHLCPRPAHAGLARHARVRDEEWHDERE